jgi:hypothetical protein
VPDDEITNDNHDRVDRMTFDSLLSGPEMAEGTRGVRREVRAVLGATGVPYRRQAVM